MSTGPVMLVPGWDLVSVTESVLLAVLASHVALDLARRVERSRGQARLTWIGIGALVMGTGVWSMHFEGMHALQLPIELGYDSRLTALSWVAAVLASAVAMKMAAGGRARPGRLMIATLAMGSGIVTMHYLGIAALEMAPGIHWNLPTVAASVVIALLASAAALALFSGTLGGRLPDTPLVRLCTAAVMGMAVAGMHYTAMAAAGFEDGSVCLSAGELNPSSLGSLVSGSTVLMLLGSLAVTTLEARLRLRADRLELSLTHAENELHRIAVHDSLTGLDNRASFEAALVKLAQQRHAPLAVLFVDIDGFKLVNESFGHVAGDELLRHVASRLRQQFGDALSIARIGADEFLVLLNAPGGDAAAILERARAALAQLSEPVALRGDTRLRLSASIGVALHPMHGAAERLIGAADTAMNIAKRAGRDQARLYDPRLATDLHEQLALLHDLQHALDHDALVLWYQPKVSALRGEFTGCEALVRWHHPVRGMIGPDAFIPLAERHGLICRLGDWILERACRQIRQWLDQGLRLQVAVNLSVHQLRQNDLAAQVRRCLEAHQVPPELLTLEITESVAMEQIQHTLEVFTQLRALGVTLSIDDFGTGYSSLSYLTRLPVQQLKIDRSFVTELDTAPHGKTIVDAVVKLGHALGLTVVAEGVETELQRLTLEALACDQLQGYLFARPMPPEALTRCAVGIDRPAKIDFPATMFLAVQPSAPPQAAAPARATAGSEPVNEPAVPEGRVHGRPI